MIRTVIQRLLVAVLSAATSDDDETGNGSALAFETLSIHRSKVVWFGKRKSHIGDYAVVTHTSRGWTSRYFTTDSKFSLDIATLTNGSRTLIIAGRSGESHLDSLAKIFENGELLSRKTADDEYVFRAGLRPGLKILLLASMEALAINQYGEYL